MNTFSLSQNDISVDQTWDLLDWCVLKGAIDFTFSVIYSEGAEDRIIPMLKPFLLKEENRTIFLRMPKTIPIYQLNYKSISILKKLLPNGLFTYDIGNNEWIEDLIIFRNKELFLGIITHENEAVLKVTIEEQSELEKMGIKTKNE